MTTENVRLVLEKYQAPIFSELRSTIEDLLTQVHSEIKLRVKTEQALKYARERIREIAVQRDQLQRSLDQERRLNGTYVRLPGDR